MADRKTSQEDEAGALTGDELLRIVQDGASRRTTIQQIVVLASGGGGIPSTLSGAQTAIETETLGISVSDSGGGITKSLALAIYDGKPLLSTEDLRVTATHYIHLQAAEELHLYADSSSVRIGAGTDVRLRASADISATASGGLMLHAAGTAGVDLRAASGPVALSGPAATIAAETLGVTLNNGGASSRAIQFTLYGATNIIVDASGANVYHKVGGNFAVSAPGSVKLQGASGVQIVSASGPISLTPSNASQAIHLQNRVSADDWPTADPAESGHLWLDGNSVRVSDGSGDDVVTIAGTTAGFAYCQQTRRGAGAKECVVQLVGYRNASGTPQTWDFPVAFDNPPTIFPNADPAATADESTLTLPDSMAAAVDAIIIIRGF